MERRIVNPWTWQDRFGFSQGWTVDEPRSIVFVSGQGPISADGEIVGEKDFEAQTRQVFENLRTVLADADEFEKLMSDPRIITVPPGEETGRFVLETAAKLDAVIVSNNTYIEYYEYYPWIEQRRIPVAVVNGSVLLLDQKMKRAG